MYFFLITILLTLLLIILGYYQIVGKLSVWKKTNRLLKYFLMTIPLIILIILFDYINTLIILIYFLIFTGIIKFLFYLLKKENHNLIILIAVLCTITYLGYGMYQDYHIKETTYRLTTAKNLGQENFRILQITDAHIGATMNGQKFYQKMQELRNISCDLVVITGDFVDDDTKYQDMIKSVEGLSLLKPQYGTIFVYGNHDKGYFQNRDFNNDIFIEELKKYHILVLEDNIYDVNNYITIIGRKDKSDATRKSIQELTKNLDKQKYLISLNHQPNDYQNEANNVDLVISGHTHGGQLFPLGPFSVLIGSNDAYYGYERRNNTDFIISSGISNWALKFKTGTKSEYVIIDIKKE